MALKVQTVIAGRDWLPTDCVQLMHAVLTRRAKDAAPIRTVGAQRAPDLLVARHVLRRVVTLDVDADLSSLADIDATQGRSELSYIPTALDHAARRREARVAEEESLVGGSADELGGTRRGLMRTRYLSNLSKRRRLMPLLEAAS